MLVRRMIFEKLRMNREALRNAGANAVAAAGRAGVPAYYRMKGKSGAIVREMPDGSRQVVVFKDGQDVVIRKLKPRKARLTLEPKPSRNI